jgi:AraC-like DNA-binding protein
MLENPPIDESPSHLPSPTSSMEDMLATIRLQQASADGVTRVCDGWRHSLYSGAGFRHYYDADVAQGGWEFCQLGPGLSLAIVDMVAARSIPRRHSLGDHLVLSAVLAGTIPISDPSGSDGKLANGYCTVYGLEAGSELETTYEADRPLKWVSVFIERHALFEATGLQPQDMPPRIGGFLLNGVTLPNCNVPLSQAALLAATQVMECPFKDGFRRAFLRAKALELACHILFILSNEISDDIVGASFSSSDYHKLRRAMQLIETNLDEPPNIAALAALVGMTRQKLQLGFRTVYGDTVARIRDKVRMERALALVSESTKPMIQIALETGYEHPASFTRAFKSTYGMSPARMRTIARQSASMACVEARTKLQAKK